MVQHYSCKKIGIIVIWIVLGIQFSFAQSTILDQKIIIQFQKNDLATAFKKIENQTNLTFAYSSNLLPSHKEYTLKKTSISIRQLLRFLFKNTELDYEIIDNQVLISKKKHFELYGIIRDKSTKEALTAATVYINNTNIGISTNNYGYYSLKVPKGKHTLIASYLGMYDTEQSISVTERKRLDISLEGQEIEFEEIIVSRPLQSDDLANAPLNQKNMMNLSEKTPSIGGEPDLLHIIRAQAGVLSSAGGMGGLYVRGGNTGHNLVLLDGVPVYNWLHLLGINSIFHPDAVRGVQFHSSGFSARYGGRLASVVDIQSREGNPEKWTGMAGINQRSYHGHLSGPLKKGAFWIGGRQSFIAPYVQSVLETAFFPEGDKEILPDYYDFNAKVNYELGLNDRLYLSYYQGRDRISGETLVDFTNEAGEKGEEIVENQLKYGNNIISFRWNHIYGKHLFSNLTLNYSNFYNEYGHLNYTNIEGEERDFIYSGLTSDNIEISLKLDYDWIFKKHHVKFGGAAHLYQFEPFVAIFDENSDFIPEFDSLNLGIDSFNNRIEAQATISQHYALYLEDEIKVSNWLNLRLGLRLSSFLTEETTFYYHLEPRFLLTAKLSDDALIAASLTKMVQYLHLVTNSDIGLPQDLWLPSDNDYKPATAWQYSLDFQKNFKNKVNIKAGLYYKSMDNLLTLPGSLTPVDFGVNASDQLLVGGGHSYGSEFSFYFQQGKWSGFGAYTLSWTKRFFENENNNQAFPFQFDSRHYIQFLTNYKINKHWEVGFRGHFSSPKPLLMSSFGSLESGLELVTPDGPKNDRRGSLEHRIDLNLNYFYATKRLEHRFSLGIYNAYNQNNPVFSYSDDGQNPLEIGMFLPQMISGYYSLKF